MGVRVSQGVLFRWAASYRLPMSDRIRIIITLFLLTYLPKTIFPVEAGQGLGSCPTRLDYVRYAVVDSLLESRYYVVLVIATGE